MEGSRGPDTSHPHLWFPEFLHLVRNRTNSSFRVFGSAMLVGVIAGLGAVAFTIACQAVVRYSLDGIAGYRSEGPANEAKVNWISDSDQSLRPWLMIVVPTVGGIISGILVFRFAPEAEGHGTDSVIAAYHNKGGEIRARVPIVKILASAITIGTGGSGGREGPIAQIGAGFGSVFGKLVGFRAKERRILVAAGMGAGIAAIFRAPLAGALFAAEVLYSSPEFESEVILPAGLACVVAYSTFGLFFGWKPLFLTPDLTFDNAWQLGPYTILAILVAILAMIYSRCFYWITWLFHRWRLPRASKPAFGAMLNGILGIGLYYAFSKDTRALSVMSFGYGILQNGFTDILQIPASLLLAIAVGKILTTSFTIGSGGSGGVFGPSMVIGGCAGGAVGLFFHQLWPNLIPHPATFMIVGMAGFFAAAAKTPFSTLIIVSELTGDYKMILPALWVCTIAYLLSDEQSLYRSQVESRTFSPAHQGSFVRQVLRGKTIADVLPKTSDVSTLSPSDSLKTVIAQFDCGPWLILPVVKPDGSLVGIIHLQELYWSAKHSDTLLWLVATDLMREKIVPLTPDTPLERAVELFAENDLPELPVIRHGKDRTLIGIVRRTDIARAYLLHVHGTNHHQT